MANQLAGGLTNWPNGISSFGIPVIGSGPNIPASTGRYFFVASNAAGSVAGYYTTITLALAQCVAGRGDVIVVEPGYAETISAAGGLTISKSGVTIIGLGNGSNRPTLTLSATASSILVTAANVTLRNLIVTCSIDEVVSAMAVSAANVTIDKVDYVETATFQLIQFLLTTAAADNLTVQNLFHVQATAPATAAQWISLIGADRARIINNTLLLTTANSATACAIGSVTTAPVNILVFGNTIVQLGGTTIASPILLMTGTSGFVGYNSVGSTATSQTGTIAIASCYGAQNFTTNVVNTNGILDPAADS